MRKKLFKSQLPPTNFLYRGFNEAECLTLNPDFVKEVTPEDKTHFYFVHLKFENNSQMLDDKEKNKKSLA